MALKSFAVKIANLVGETGLYRALFPGAIPVFMLHRFTDEVGEIAGALSADLLRDYLRYLSTHGYHVLSMDELWNSLNRGSPVPSKAVMFTIDDGFYDHHDVVAAVFDEFGYKLNFFVITGLLDRELWPWDDQVVYALNRASVGKADIQLPSGERFSLDLQQLSLRDAARGIRTALKTYGQDHIYDWIRTVLFKQLNVEFPPGVPKAYHPMTWDDARSLRRRGHGVYPHTRSHRILSALPDAERRFEILESQKRVQAELNFFPEIFAYPTGRLVDYGAADINILKQAGFTMAFNTVPTYVNLRSGQDPYAIPRFSLPENLADFLQIVNRFEAVKDSLKTH